MKYSELPYKKKAGRWHAESGIARCWHSTIQLWILSLTLTNLPPPKCYPNKRLYPRPAIAALRIRIGSPKLYGVSPCSGCRFHAIPPRKPGCRAIFNHRNCRGLGGYSFFILILTHLGSCGISRRLIKIGQCPGLRYDSISRPLLSTYRPAWQSKTARFACLAAMRKTAKEE